MRVANLFACVTTSERISALADAFNQHKELPVVGVIDQDGRCTGVITRVHLFSLLGRPFGRELLQRKSVSEITQEVTTFSVFANLFQVAGTIQDSIDNSMISFYSIVDNNGLFQGIFSSKDILYYLSRITQDDIELAAQLQERIVPASASWHGEKWRANAISKTAKGVGGDIYYHRALDKNREFFALGDVSGKGVAASVLTSLVWGTLNAFTFGKSLKNMLTLLNDSLIQTFQLEKYLTGIFMIMDTSSLHLTIADMGHGHVGLMRNGDIFTMSFPKLNMPLGIQVDIEPKIYRMKLKPGDLFFTYTDGITEQLNEENEEFGSDRLHKNIVTCSGACDRIPALILESYEKWRGSMPPQDDLSWLQIEAVDSEKETTTNSGKANLIPANVQADEIEDPA